MWSRRFSAPCRDLLEPMLPHFPGYLPCPLDCWVKRPGTRRLFWYVQLFLARVPDQGSRSRRLCSRGGCLIRSWRLGPDMDMPASEPPLSSRLGVERLLCVEPSLREVRPKSRVGRPLDLPASRCCLSYRLRTSACHPVVW